jgi:hypothetical protein
MHGMVEGADSDGARHVASQRCGQCGSADGLVAHVGDDESGTVGEQLRVGLDEVLEVADGLFFPLDEELHPDRRTAPEGAQCARVDDDPRLVVGRASAVDAPISAVVGVHGSVSQPWASGAGWTS